jgi:hypothetical protein
MLPSMIRTVGPAIPGALSAVSCRVLGAASCRPSIVSSSKDIISSRFPAPTRTFFLQCCHSLLPPLPLNNRTVLNLLVASDIAPTRYSTAVQRSSSPLPISLQAHRCFGSADGNSARLILIAANSSHHRSSHHVLFHVSVK